MIRASKVLVNLQIVVLHVNDTINKLHLFSSIFETYLLYVCKDSEDVCHFHSKLIAVETLVTNKNYVSFELRIPQHRPIGVVLVTNETEG